MSHLESDFSFLLASLDGDMLYGMSYYIPPLLCSIVPSLREYFRYESSENIVTYGRHLGLVMKTYLGILYDRDGDGMERQQYFAQYLADLPEGEYLKYLHIFKCLQP